MLKIKQNNNSDDDDDDNTDDNMNNKVPCGQNYRRAGTCRTALDLNV